MFKILCMGIGYEHEPDFAVERPEGYPHYLALLIRSKCKIMVDGEIKSFPQNTFVLYDAGVPQYYAADGETYIDDWMQFECEPELIESFAFPLNSPIVVPEWMHPEQYFSLICNTFFRCYNDDAVINSLITAMLTDFSKTLTDSKAQIPLYGQLVQLRQRIYAAPQNNWNVTEIAAEFHVSVSYFQRLYRKAFGIPIMKDVIYRRVEAAKTLLHSTDMTVDEIAERCGYSVTEHFSRQFKQYTGLSPAKWRKEQ